EGEYRVLLGAGASVSRPLKLDLMTSSPNTSLCKQHRLALMIHFSKPQTVMIPNLPFLHTERWCCAPSPNVPASDSYQASLKRAVKHGLSPLSPQLPAATGSGIHISQPRIFQPWRR
ncbi:Bifunctional protein FolD 2, partial [Dissostichus eleginoides]